MIYLQQTPAQTAGYFIAGYGVIFGVIALYIGSLAIRMKNQKQDYELLKKLGNSDQV